MLRIYLTNLGKYNEGELIGEWLDLPVTGEELDEVKQRIGINEEYEEWFITDYESDVDGIEIGEYADIDELNEIAEMIEGFSSDDIEILEAILDSEKDIQTAIEKFKNYDYISYIGCNTMGDVAERYCDECGISNEIPEELRYYFDFEAYGRDMAIEGNFVSAPNGYVQIL